VLRKAMPDALDLMVICAESRPQLDATFERVSREVGPTSPELAEEVGLTASNSASCPNVPRRCKIWLTACRCKASPPLTNTLIQTEKYGTPLAQSLRVLSGEMREERMMGRRSQSRQASRHPHHSDDFIYPAAAFYRSYRPRCT